MALLWTRLAELPLVIESVEYERRSAMVSADFERITTLLHLAGAGEEGLGEDISIFKDESAALHTLGPGAVPVAGEWTLGSFCDHLATARQWAEEPEWDMARRWRNWGFESAALDLALRQAGKPLHELLERESRPLTVRQLARARRGAELRPDRPPAREASRPALQDRRPSALEP